MDPNAEIVFGSKRIVVIDQEGIEFSDGTKLTSAEIEQIASLKGEGNRVVYTDACGNIRGELIPKEYGKVLTSTCGGHLYWVDIKKFVKDVVEETMETLKNE